MAKGTLIAKNVSRRMSPTTGLDTDYTYEWRVQSEPGTQYPYSVHRIFTKNGEQMEDSVMSVGQTANEAIRDLYAHSVETVLNQAEKFGLFKSLFTREESKKKKDAETKRLAEERQVREDAENSERFNRVFSPFRTLKGLKETEIQIDVFKSNDFKERGKRAVKGYDVGNGVGVAIEGEGRYRGYTVTHLNTGLAMGSSFNKRDEAVALARAVSKIADWSKWQTEKDVPKGVMETAAGLVRAARSKLLDAKLEKALETGTTIKPKQEVKLVSPAADLQWSEPKAKLEKIADEFRRYYGKKVTIYGGGGAPPSTAILQRVELHPTILKGKDGYTLKAYVKGADSKILPTDRGGEWDFWLGSWQIAVNPRQARKAVAKTANPGKDKQVIYVFPKPVNPITLRKAPVQAVRGGGTWQVEVVGDIHDLSEARLKSYQSLAGSSMQPTTHLQGDLVELIFTFDTKTAAEGAVGRLQGHPDFSKSKGKTTDLQAIHDSRSHRSKESDERQSNADTIEPDDPRVERWIRDAGSMDVRGIDTPRKGKGKKVARKTRKSTRTETQVRGIRK